MSTQLHYKTLVAGGANISYIEAGAPDLPTLVLFHGFPASASQYVGLIPLLATHYHVLAPSFPGFGSTAVLASNYTYTFANLASTIFAFLAALDVGDFAAYIFDYGAPVFFRIAVDHIAAGAASGNATHGNATMTPASRLRPTAIITQNGNAYVQGLGQDFWAPVERYWRSGSQADRDFLRDNVLTLKGTEDQYRIGVPEYKQDRINPDTTYMLDYLQNEAASSGRQDIQLDLFYDYRTNVESYPKWQKYLRESHIPVFAIWGKGDIAFIPAGAEAYKTDVPSAKVRFINTGHFAVTTDADVIASQVKVFLASINY